VGLDGQLYSGVSTFAISELAVGTYTLSLPYVYANGSDGTRYLPSISSTTLTGVVGGYLIDANAWLNLSYDTQYLVNASASTGGTVSPSGPGWYASGSQLPLTATPSAGQLFVAWAGAGPGAVSSLTASFALLVNGPASEVATFQPAPPPPVETFALTVTETGLSAGTAWTAVIGTSGFPSVATTVTTQLPNGTYEVALPIVPGPAGVRYVPDPAFTNVTIAGGVGAASVAYATQFRVALAASPGGSINATSAWFANGSLLQVTATPTNSSETFVNWTGVGAGSYTGATPMLSLVVGAPISESAAFAPIPPAAGHASGASSNASTGLLISIGLLVALLIVGVVVGLLLLRRRPPRSRAAASESAVPEEEPLYGQSPPAAEP
jgi:Divergent InlB B-repeat domain